MACVAVVTRLFETIKSLPVVLGNLGRTISDAFGLKGLPFSTTTAFITLVLIAFSVLGIVKNYLSVLGIRSSQLRSNVPISVNYHFSRRCNKSCGFCFHTATTSFKLSIEEAKRGLKLLKDAGMQKVNFAGGEPFLYKKFLGAMVSYCKEIGVESVSIVTNGSLVDRNFLENFGQYIDILAVSCDSFDEQTNIKIGRGDGDNVTKLFQISGWCQEFGIKFKLNTVVCRLNFQENMNSIVSQLQPFRWKCFQVLMVAGENDSEKTLRDVRKFQITDEEYQQFCDRHKDQSSLVAESNKLMARSYLILDEYMRFLNRDGREPSGSILEVGVHTALDQVFWDKDSFVARDGIYDWTRESTGGSGCKSYDERLEF